MPSLKSAKSLTPGLVARTIGVPLKRWEGNCYGIACKMVEKKLCPGKAVFGHYRGPIADGTRWEKYAHLGFVRHGWVLTAGRIVIDPTRWSFEGVKPYIFFGDPDPELGYHPDYDRGGNVFREQCRRPCPSRREEPVQSVQLVFSDPDTDGFMRTLMDSDDISPPTTAQVLWLANLPLPVLGRFAFDVYSAIAESGHDAFIPIDNRREVLGR